jgi:hypothetical protein
VWKTALPACACLVLALTPVAANAGVKVVVGPDGRKAIVDDGAGHPPSPRAGGASKPVSTRLREVPDAEVEILINRHSELQSLDPRLVMAVIQAESGYNRRAVSRKGAMGLMQLTSDTARLLAVGDPFNPGENVRGGTTYLRWMIDRFAGNLEFALAAYNAGPAAVERHNGIPPFRETREYVRRVLALYNGRDMVVEGTAPQGPIRKARLVRNAENRLVLTTALVH